MKTILVTGSNGQLASCIKDVVNQNNDLNMIYTDYLELDISDLNQVESFFDANKIDYCINCAAYTAVDNAESETEKVFKINTLGPKYLAQTCKNHSVVLIHISTDFVFDGKKAEPYVETDITKPISVYGESKLQGEVEVQKILKEHFIIRTAWLYSEYGQNFMKTMIRLAETRDEISVVSDQFGTPTYAKDLADVIKKIITTNNQNFGLYHYSNKGIASWYDFAKAIFIFSKKTIKTTPIKTSDYFTLATRPHYSVLDKTKITTNININIHQWRESLKKAISNLNLKTFYDI